MPPGAGESPYSSTSAFALSPWLIDLRQLGDLIDAPHEQLRGGRLDADAMRAFKGSLLVKAATSLLAKGRSQLDA